MPKQQIVEHGLVKSHLQFLRSIVPYIEAKSQYTVFCQGQYPMFTSGRLQLFDSILTNPLVCRLDRTIRGEYTW
jgi:hypothetical protein